MKNVTLRQLKTLEVVARHLSISRAAQELCLTQPAVSMQIRSLEESVGLALFEHIGKKTYLTPGGKELLRHARVINQQLKEAEAALAELSGSYSGLLDIGVISTAKYFVPGLLAHFCKRFPQAEVKLTVCNREELLRCLGENCVDVAVMGQPPETLDCVAERFAENPLAIVAAPSHPLSRRARLKLADLAKETFLVRESGSGTRGTMERVFRELASFEPKRQIEMGSNETIKQAVMVNMGVAFLSLRTVRHELAAGRLVQLTVEGLPVIRHWHVVHLRNKRLSPLNEEFRQFLMAEGNALIEAA